MFGRKRDERDRAQGRHTWQPPVGLPNYDRGRPQWTGVRYEYLFLSGLPLGDTDQRHLCAAGAAGWRVVQVDVEKTHTGYATGVWALLERELPPLDQEPAVSYSSYDVGQHTRRGDYAELRSDETEQPVARRPFADEHGWRAGDMGGT